MYLHTADWKVDKEPLINRSILNQNHLKNLGNEGIASFSGRFNKF